MSYYFTLQWRRYSRWIKEQGINPWLGLFLLGIGFIVCSKLLFYKLEVASWVYLGCLFYAVGILSGKERNDKLKMLSQKGIYRKWRVIENVIVGSPFVIYLVYERAIWEAVIGFVLMLGLSQLNGRIWRMRTIPSPFGRIPFEGIVGFRRTIILFILYYFLLIKSIQVDNVNLGLVVLVFTFATQLSFYLKPEHENFVWIFSLSRNQFIKHKWKHAILVATVLSIPFAVILSCFYPTYLAWIFAVSFIGYAWIIFAVLTKYASFPKEMNVIQGFIFAFSIILFPLMIFFIPLFYRRALRKLEHYME